MSKLLMIDNNPMEHFIIDKLIKRQTNSPDVIHFTDASSVIKLLKDNKNNFDGLPDLIFLNLNLPVFNGWDFLESFKEIKSTLKKEIRIYILSPSINIKDYIRSKKYPFIKSYIIKPISSLLIQQIFSNHKSS